MHFDGFKNKGRIFDCPSIARVEFNEHGKQAWMDESFLSLEYLAKYYEVTQKDDRVKKLTDRNEEVLLKIAEVATHCSGSYTTLRLLLEDWTAIGGEIPIRSVCPTEDQEKFNRTMLGTQNTLAMQTEALEVANAERIKANYRKPWITISNGKRGYSGPVPETEAELLALLKKYGGE